MPGPVAGRPARLLPKRDCAGMRGKMEEGDDSTGPWLWDVRGTRVGCAANATFTSTSCDTTSWGDRVLRSQIL